MIKRLHKSIRYKAYPSVLYVGKLGMGGTVAAIKQLVEEKPSLVIANLTLNLPNIIKQEPFSPTMIDNARDCTIFIDNVEYYLDNRRDLRIGNIIQHTMQTRRHRNVRFIFTGHYPWMWPEWFKYNVVLFECEYQRDIELLILQRRYRGKTYLYPFLEMGRYFKYYDTFEVLDIKAQVEPTNA